MKSYEKFWFAVCSKQCVDTTGLAKCNFVKLVFNRHFAYARLLKT